MINAKCQNCNQWSERMGLETDCCTHCGALLDEQRISYRKEKHKVKEQSEAESITFIRDDDSPQKRRLKKAIIWGRVIFLLLIVLVTLVVFGSHG